MKFFGLVLIGCLVSGGSFARDNSKHERGEFLKKELGLTDEQYAKVKSFKEADRKELETIRKNFKELKKSFNETMKKTSSTNEELKQKFDEFQKARDQYQRARFEKMLKMRGVLTPEQLEKFSKAMDKHKSKRGKKRDQRK